MIRVTFLGTAAARPTVGRNVSSVAVQREGELWLFDCGEGTQRQMMRFATGFALEGIFVTHLHADHFLGIIGLVRTLGLQGRTEPLAVHGPPGSADTLDQAIHLGANRPAFPIEIVELQEGDRIRREEYDIEAFAVRHGVSAVGYALREHARAGRFDVERARALGVPEGPLFGKLHRGEAVEIDGRTVRPVELVGPPRPGRLVVYTGDTRPQDRTVDVAAGAELLIHDGTFTSAEAERARETFHATASEAAGIALRAGVDRLVLTHVSARYAQQAQPLEDEARAVFPRSTVAHDGLALEIGYGKEEG